MKSLHRKLLRDLRRMAAQLMAIALVVASGVALFVGTMAAYRSLRLSEAHYYEQQRFADVWSSLARAPLSLARRIRALPGVAAVDARIVTPAILDLPGLVEPASALLVSIPESAEHQLNGLHVRPGRHVEAGRSGEVMVSEAFAERNRLRPGGELVAIVAGRRLTLKISGIALSPEYVMQIPPGGRSPDDQRFGVIWMSRHELETLVDLRGAFNEVALKLGPRAQESALISELDRVLEPYGGRGAYGRSSQVSHVMLEEHIDQLRGLAVIVPSIFLAVAAFLVNVVLGRIVATEREQVGMLKAFGYSNGRVAAHYLELTLAVVGAGVFLGLPVGAWLGKVMAVFYATFFRFPVLVFRVELWVVGIATLVALGAASAGAFGSVRHVMRLPPIVAMAPEIPAYSRGIIDRLSLQRLLPTTWRMILRSVARRPLRAGLTSAGMTLAVAVVVLGSSINDAIHRSEDVQFQAAQREDIAVNLSRLRPLHTFREFAGLPGVRRVEPFRAVPARIGGARASEDVLLLGLPSDGALRRAVGSRYEQSAVVPGAAIVTSWVGERFQLRRGDVLTVEVREGRRRTIRVRIAGFIDEPLGKTVYMEIGGLGRLLGEPNTYSGVNLLLDPVQTRAFHGKLKRTSEAVAVAVRRGTLANFRAMSEAVVAFVRQIEVIFSVIIAFGVVYNSARIALAERSRELATLRVLGFTRAEISAILLGEIALLATPAIPLGLFVGYELTRLVIVSLSSSSMHIPIVVDRATFAFAVVVFVVSALVSALVVRRRIDSLDLIGVLKARE
jgi:putative ABC transport system permease protein